jgi:hypothetical protein
MGTYIEIETQWNFLDIMEANEVLDIKEDMHHVMTPKISSKEDFKR